MPKYDAFGREIGEDTLSGLGGGDSSSAQATPQPAPSPSPAPPDGWTAVSAGPVAAPPPQPAPQDAPQPPVFTIPGTGSVPGVHRRRRGTGLGCLISLVVLAAIVAGPVIALVSFVGDANDAIDDVTGIFDIDTPTLTPDEPGSEADAEPPTGLDEGSMVLRGTFAGAVKELESAHFGAPMLIRLSPDRAWFQMVKGGSLRGATLDWEGDFDRGTTSQGAAGARTVPLGALDTGAPAKLVRAVAAKYPVLKTGRIDYLVMLPEPIEKGHRWLAYYKDGKGYVQGDERGRIEQRFKP